MKRYERIRNLREDNDMTQSQVGNYLHISQRCYAHYEAGTRDIPIEILIQLANLYQVNLDYLVERTNQKKCYQNLKNFPYSFFINRYDSFL